MSSFWSSTLDHYRVLPLSNISSMPTFCMPFAQTVPLSFFPSLPLDNFFSSSEFPQINLPRAANTITFSLNYSLVLFSITALCAFPHSFSCHLLTQIFICFDIFLLLVQKYLLSLLPDFFFVEESY